MTTTQTVVCRICGDTPETMYKCSPTFIVGNPMPFGLCSRCMAIGLSAAHRAYIGRMRGLPEELHTEELEERFNGSREKSFRKPIVTVKE